MHEQHYPTHDLELADVVLALNTLHQYLLGNLVHIHTDQKSLKYIFIQPDLKYEKKIWLEFIKDNKLEIHYHPGIAT